MGRGPSPEIPGTPATAGHPLMRELPPRLQLSVRTLGENLGGLDTPILQTLARTMREVGVRVELTTRYLRDAQLRPYTEVEILHNDQTLKDPQRFGDAARAVATRLSGVSERSDATVQNIIDEVLGKGQESTPATTPRSRKR